MLSAIVTNTVGTNSKPKNTDKNKIMETNVSKANCSLCGENKIERGKNIHLATENKMPDGKKNEFMLEGEEKVEGKVFVSHHINGARESNRNVNIKWDNVLSANDEVVVNILASLKETEINISHVIENSNGINNTKLGGSSNTNSITIDQLSISKGNFDG